MGPRLLTRRCVGDCLRQAAFFLVAYLALISIAVTAPLIRGGAPLDAVIAFLPDQMALPATLALPLALVTAILTCIGRMRDDGEVIALQAAGVSPLQVVLSLLPLVLVTCLAVGLMAHQILPGSFQRWREGKSALLRQAVATKVARRTFIFSDAGNAMAADAVDGERLIGLFASRVDDDGGKTLLFAPEARWVARSNEDRDSLAIHLQLERARLLATAAGDARGDVTSGTFPSLVLHLEQPNPVWASKADTMPTDLLGRRIAAWHAAIAANGRSGDPRHFLQAVVERPTEILEAGQVGSWPRLVEALRQPDTAITEALAPAVTDLIDAAAADEGRARSELLHRLDAALPQALDAPGVVPSLPKPLASLTTKADDDARRTIARYALDRAAERYLVPSPTSAVLHRVLRTVRDSDGRHHQLQEELRVDQMVWHLRWLLAALPLSYWLFASGLAMGSSSSNRLLAACIALATVLATLLPGVALAKNTEGHLPFNPAWVMWGGWLGLASLGAWLCWRRR